jgi:hypothetical protein
MPENSAINPLPPPWGPRFDSHFLPQCQGEGHNYHTQVMFDDAIKFGWFFRSEWYKRLVPDTRRCRNCGQQLFTEVELTDAQIGELYRFQDNGMATGPIG